MRSRIVSLRTAAVTLIGALTLAAAATAADAAPAPPAGSRGAFPGVIWAHAPNLIPESVAYDPTRSAFLVSSLTHGTVSVACRDGSVMTLVSDPRLVSTIGVKVDAPRSRLLVANSDPGTVERSSPTTAFHLAGLGIYDLATGRRLHYVDLAAVAADAARHFANDITIGPDGTAYVTDVVAPIIYRIGLTGRASVLVRDSRLASPTFGLNGLVWLPGLWDRVGYLLVGKSDDGNLFRVPLRQPSTLLPVQLSSPLVGFDGMLRRPDGTLLVATNRSGFPDATNAVNVVRSNDGWRTAWITTIAWPDPTPTSVTATRRGDYVLSGRLDLFLAGSNFDTFTLRRFPSSTLPGDLPNSIPHHPRR